MKTILLLIMALALLVCAVPVVATACDACGLSVLSAAVDMAPFVLQADDAFALERAGPVADQRASVIDLMTVAKYDNTDMVTGSWIADRGLPKPDFKFAFGEMVDMIASRPAHWRIC